MEKRTPHCKLMVVHTLVRAGKVRATQTALLGVAALGLSNDDMLEVILNLTTKDFFKSMTSYADSTIWQDVYRPRTAVGAVYLKLTVVDDVLVVSFKGL